MKKALLIALAAVVALILFPILIWILFVAKTTSDFADAYNEAGKAYAQVVREVGSAYSQAVSDTVNQIDVRAYNAKMITAIREIESR